MRNFSMFWENLPGGRKRAAGTRETSAGLGVGVQVRGITGEKVPLLIAALELWPALWNTKGRSDTLHCLGLVNICPALLECPAFLLGSPTNHRRLRPPTFLAALICPAHLENTDIRIDSNILCSNTSRKCLPASGQSVMILMQMYVEVLHCGQISSFTLA